MSIFRNDGRPEDKSTILHVWPQLPPMPQRGQPLIVRIPTSLSRQDAKKEVSKVLREILSFWSGLRADNLPLEETFHGPSLDGRLFRYALDISLSYSVDEAWIGFISGGHIGVDIMAVEEISEMENVSSIYLDPEVWPLVLNADNPSLAFASAWTEREARLKCLKKGLVEWSAEQGVVESKCSCMNLAISDILVGAVATR